MNSDITTSEYLLLFRGNHWDHNLSPQELQDVTSQWMAWYDRLSEQGKLKSGHPLLPEGKLVSGKKGMTIADGPFAESKEAIAGYFLLHLDDFQEALQIAQQCPALDYGLTVEVRPVAARCPACQRASQQLEHALA